MEPLEEFYALEDDPEILSFRFSLDRRLMWPLVRVKVADQLLQSRTGLPDPHPVAHPSSGLKSPIDGVRYLARVAARSPFRLAKKWGGRFDILVLNSAVGNSFKRDGRYFNRISDYFAGIFPEQTLLVEMSARFDLRLPRHFPHVCSQDALELTAVALGRLGRSDPRDRAEAGRLVNFLKGKIGDSFDSGFIADFLVVKSRQLRYYQKLYQRLYQLLKPRLLLIEDGSYGRQSYLIALAKEMGITVAEFQHGLVSRAHRAYNYGSAVRNSSDYRRCLPDYFLSYGPYWDTQINTPSRRVAVGNPHYESTLAEYRGKAREPGPETVLIAPEGLIHAEIAALVRELARLLGPGRRIVLKLHPMEAPFAAQRYGGLMRLPNVTITGDGDIYRHIFDADFVVSTCSTTIFEAMGFGRPVFILDSVLSRMHIPQGVAPTFKTAGELDQLIRQHSRPGGSWDAGQYWAPGWERNYRDFVGRVLNPGEIRKDE